MKPGFFDGVPSFSGINVLDVYKVENKPLLDRFQKCAALMEPGKVKGLFTSVPAKSVERTVVLGFGNPPTAITESDDDDEQGVSKISGGAAVAKSSVFRRAWYAFHDKGNGYAETIVDGAEVAKFPRSFSRYSTVEVDRSSEIRLVWTSSKHPMRHAIDYRSIFRSLSKLTIDSR